jgi:hypothetical protein
MGSRKNGLLRKLTFGERIFGQGIELDQLNEIISIRTELGQFADMVKSNSEKAIDLLTTIAKNTTPKSLKARKKMK